MIYTATGNDSTTCLIQRFSPAWPMSSEKLVRQWNLYCCDGNQRERRFRYPIKIDWLVIIANNLLTRALGTLVCAIVLNGLTCSLSRQVIYTYNYINIILYWSVSQSKVFDDNIMPCALNERDHIWLGNGPIVPKTKLSFKDQYYTDCAPWFYGQSIIIKIAHYNKIFEITHLFVHYFFIFSSRYYFS